ncbi:11313_t:CDS:2, partial [Gigaspora margarita]
ESSTPILGPSLADPQLHPVTLFGKLPRQVSNTPMTNHMAPNRQSTNPRELYSKTLSSQKSRPIVSEWLNGVLKVRACQ